MTSSDKFKRVIREIPNALSVVRGLLGCCIPFFLYSPKPSFHMVALACFIFGALTDYMDGYIARKFSWVSSIGKIIDPTTDKILILAPLYVFCELQLIPYFWGIIMIIRETAVTFCRIGLLIEGKAIGAEKIGKLKFVLQVGTVLLGFAYFLSFDYTPLASSRNFIHVLLLVAVSAAGILTLVSGVSFFYANGSSMQSFSFAKFTSALGVGFAPLAPGTWGSLAGLAMILIFHPHPASYRICFAFFMLLGYWSYSRMQLKKHEDPGFFIIDEVCGMFVTFWGVPINALTAMLGFALFRIFDVWKPFPVRRLEKLPGYWGVLFDDLGAGIYGRICMALILRFVL